MSHLIETQYLKVALLGILELKHDFAHPLDETFHVRDGLHDLQYFLDPVDDVALRRHLQQPSNLRSAQAATHLFEKGC